MTVRSQQLVEHQANGTAGTFDTVYTVPAGTRTIVKSIVVALNGAQDYSVSFKLGGAGNELYCVFATSPAGRSFSVTNLFVVLLSGDTIRCRSSIAANAWFHVGGAELAT